MSSSAARVASSASWPATGTCSTCSATPALRPSTPPAGAPRPACRSDLSNTYLDWTRRNLELNRLDSPSHRIVRADAVEWIKSHGARYGPVYLNPPTFSRSKAMTGTLDIERDHVWLLRAVARLLARDGILLFTTGARRFKLDAAALPELEVEDLSRQLLPPDFKRTPHAHRVFRIRRHEP